jgi:hypothetical protein
LVFRQEATAASIAVLDRPFEHFVQTEASNVTTSVPAGAPLYELTSRSIHGRLFCSIDNTITLVWRQAPRSNALVTVDPNARPLAGQACFVDDDGDGRFEELTSIAGQGARNSPGFGGMMVVKYDIEPIAYTLSAVHDPRTSSLGVRFEGGGLRVVGIVDDGAFAWRDAATQDGPYLLTDSWANIPRRLPATLELNGARIEVLSHDGDAITYRVLQGFPTQPPIAALLH